MFGSSMGLPHAQVTVGVSGREIHGGVHDGLVFDGGQSAQAGLSATTVVGAFDPGDDRDAELFSSPPALAVQDVLLQQREEGLHRGVISAGTDRSEEHTSELQSRGHLVCRLLLEKKKSNHV